MQFDLPLVSGLLHSVCTEEKVVYRFPKKTQTQKDKKETFGGNIGPRVTMGFSVFHTYVYSESLHGDWLKAKKKTLKK